MRPLLLLSSPAALLVAGTIGSAQSWVNFTDVSSSKLISHIGQPSLLTLGQIGSADERASCFVVGDFDRDGLKDVAVFCKSPNFDNSSPGGGPLVPHVLLRNVGNGALADVTPGLAPDFNAHPSQAREAIAVDVENDGDLDIVVGNTCAMDPFLFLNRGGIGGAWLGFKRKLSWFTTEHGQRSFLQDYGGGLNCSSLAAGDVDADGDADLVLGCYNPANPYVQAEAKDLEHMGGQRLVGAS